MTAPATTEPAPMPHPNDDPDFAVAREAQANYTSTVANLRAHPNFDGFWKAERIAEAHANYMTAISAATERLNARWKARLDWLSAQIPTGHGIPDTASPAERAALMAVFRGHYDQAVTLNPQERAKMLDDADRFGDDPARRAALTAILERGELHTLRDRPDRYATLLAHVEEIGDLQRGGSLTYRSFTRQAFTLAPTPPEIAQLDRLLVERQERLANERQHGYRG